MTKARLTISDLFQIFNRCFFIQGSWNFKSLLGIGFCYSAIPIAKRLYKTKEEQQEFLHRHLDFFNSHPYYASWCLGAVAKLEQDAIQEGWSTKQPISIFKERVVGPLGAIGDQIFWNGLKPLLSGFGVLLALLVGWYATIIFLILYNIPHIYVRLSGFINGFQKGFNVIDYLAIDRYKKTITVIAVLGALVAGAFMTLAGKWSYDQEPYYLIVFGVSFITLIIFQDLQKPVWLALLISIFFSLIIKIIVYFN